MSAAAPRLLMCRPTTFEVRYAINPWMFGQVADSATATTQFDSLVETYRSLGCRIELIDYDPLYPDMVFTANAGLPINGGFIASNFRYPERMGESRVFSEWIAGLGIRVHWLPASTFFEGAGDALFVGDRIILGTGFRTAAQASEDIQMLVGDTPVMRVSLSNPYFYHLDTCLSPLPSGRFVFFPDAFDDKSRKRLEALGGYWVTEQFCVRYGCNMVVVGTTIVTSWADERLHEIAEIEGLDVRIQDVSEFLKAGGGVRCLTLPL